MNRAGIAHVLIVEDDPALQDVYRMILSSQGYQVSVAGNGMAALSLLHGQRSSRAQPDMILLDVYMPQMDGKEFLKNLDLEDYPGIKIIVCSNLPDRDIMDEMIGLGAHGYILKSSLSPNDLLKLVETTLQSPA